MVHTTQIRDSKRFDTLSCVRNISRITMCAGGAVAAGCFLLDSTSPEANWNPTDYQNAWLYLFSSTAQTIAAISALMLALATLRLQHAMNSIKEHEEQIASAFYRIAEIPAYSAKIDILRQTKQWDKYCEAVRSLIEIKAIAMRFTSPNDHYPDSILCMERNLEAILHHFHLEQTMRASVRSGLISTSIFIIVTLALIPASIWITPTVFVSSWIAITAALILSVTSYWPVIQDILPNNPIDSKT